MATRVKSVGESPAMAKDKLNGSAERFAAALRDMVRDAAREAVEPIKDDIGALKADVGALKTDVAELRGDMGSGFKDAAEERQRLRSDMEENIRQLRGDMENGFAELRPPK